MINIAFAADDNYAVPVAVAITSLLVNKNESINLYLLNIRGNFSIENKKKLTVQVNKYNTEIHYVELEPSELIDFPILRHGLSAYLRIYSPFLIKEVDKLLYLDSDIIIERPLDELYHTDLEDNDYAAVADLGGFARKNYLKSIGYTFNRHYINSGVLLMNFKKLRQYNLKDLMIPYVNKYKDNLNYSDQDIINCLWERIKILPPQYNAMTPIFYNIKNSPWNELELETARCEPYIIHYVTKFKPWFLGVRHPYKSRWYHYLKLTSYSCLYSVIDFEIIKILVESKIKEIKAFIRK